VADKGELIAAFGFMGNITVFLGLLMFVKAMRLKKENSDARAPNSKIG